MNKSIFENEKECMEYLKDIITFSCSLDERVKKSKELGYIKKTAVDELEYYIMEIKYELKHDIDKCLQFHVLEKIIKLVEAAIKSLKS